MNRAGDAHSVSYLRRNWKGRVLQPTLPDEPAQIIPLRPVEAAVILWAAYPKGQNARHYQVDCKHGTSNRTVQTDQPWDDSMDGVILSGMIDEHQANIAADPDTWSLCGCIPNVVAPS